jgi:hypothetical protein
MICCALSLLDAATRAFSFVKELVLLGVAVASVIIAGMGLRTWRRQLHGTARHDAAFKVLRAAIELRNALRDVRRARLYKLPLEAGLSSEDLLQKKYEQHRQRTDPVFAARDHLQAAELDAAVLFGEDPVRQALSGLYDSFVGFAVAFEEYYQIELQRVGSGEGASSDARDLLRTIYQPHKDDEFGAAMDQAFQRARDFFSPHFR